MAQAGHAQSTWAYALLIVTEGEPLPSAAIQASDARIYLAARWREGRPISPELEPLAEQLFWLARIEATEAEG